MKAAIGQQASALMNWRRKTSGTTVDQSNPNAPPTRYQTIAKPANSRHSPRTAKKRPNPTRKTGTRLLVIKGNTAAISLLPRRPKRTRRDHLWVSNAMIFSAIIATTAALLTRYSLLKNTLHFTPAPSPWRRSRPAFRPRPAASRCAAFPRGSSGSSSRAFPPGSRRSPARRRPAFPGSRRPDRRDP